jgi:hypothetical protein
MTDTTQAAPAAPTNAINTFFANLKTDFQILEEDVISVIQNIGAGIEVAAADITYCLSWLGNHLGQVATTMTAVQNSITTLQAAGVTIPQSLTNAVAQINAAAIGVNEALNNQAVDANPSKALSTGYQATKILQIAAASGASIAAAIQATVAPTPAAPIPTA